MPTSSSNLFIQYLSIIVNIASVLSGLGVFFWVFRQDIKNGNEVRLENLMQKSLGGSAFPTGVVLLICAFKPELIAYLSGLNFHIAMAGLALLFISAVSVFGTTWLNIQVSDGEKTDDNQSDKKK